MRIDFNSPSHRDEMVSVRPSIDPMSVIIAAFVLAVVAGVSLWAVRFSTSNAGSVVADAAPRREAALHDKSIPFGERDSLVGCGNRGYGISACLESEAALRPKAQALWKERSADVRRVCMGRTSPYEPVGLLYTCLAATESVPAPRWP